MVIKIGVKGRVVRGRGAPFSEVLIEKNKESWVGAYYIYIWPNDGTKWPGTNTDMVYDDWYETWENVEKFFKDEGWEVEWYAEDDPRNDVVKHLNPDSGV